MASQLSGLHEPLRRISADTSSDGSSHIVMDGSTVIQAGAVGRSSGLRLRTTSFPRASGQCAVHALSAAKYHSVRSPGFTIMAPATADTTIATMRSNLRIPVLSAPAAATPTAVYAFAPRR